MDFKFNDKLRFKNFHVYLGKPQKTVLPLMDGPLRQPPPSPSSLVAVGTLEKKVPKKFFFLNGPALCPPSPYSPAIKKRTFFCGFP